MVNDKLLLSGFAISFGLFTLLRANYSAKVANELWTKFLKRPANMENQYKIVFYTGGILFIIFGILLPFLP